MAARSAERTGFTMIEMLVVIAIIAILLAILFPVFAKVRIKVQETRCTSNLHQISQALQLYKDNWDRYPIVIDSFVAPVGNSAVLVRTLFPQYLKSEEVLHCPTASYLGLDANTNFLDPANAGKLTSLNPEQIAKQYHVPSGVAVNGCDGLPLPPVPPST